MYLFPLNQNNGSQTMEIALIAPNNPVQPAIITPPSNYSNHSNINSYQVITQQSISNWVVLNNDHLTLYYNTDNISSNMNNNAAHTNTNCNTFPSQLNPIIFPNVNNYHPQPATPTRTPTRRLTRTPIRTPTHTPTPTPTRIATPTQNGNAFCSDNLEIKKPKNEKMLSKGVQIAECHPQIHSNDCFQCKYCPQQFSTKNNLKQHQQTHSKEKPYKCSFCQKCFSQRYRLRDHIRTHTGERPFQCDICWKRFSLKHNLTVHKRIHSKKK